MKFRMLLFVTCIIILLLLFADGLGMLHGIGNYNSKPLSDSRNNNLIQHQETELKENSEKPEQNELNNENLESDNMVTQDIDSNKKYEKDYVNLLVLGLDEYEARTDVILILNYSLQEGKLNILSIPRDTKVYVNGKPEKINALYLIGGVPMVRDRIKKITGLTTDYYVTLNFKGFRKIIDILDGVEFDVPINMNYDDPVQNLHIHIKKGKQILNGRQAEGLVRFRKGNNNESGYEDGDIGRIRMQQEFIKAFIKQKLKIKYISKADEIFNILREYMKTNIEIYDVRYYLKGLRNFDYDQIKSYTLPGDSVFQNKLWYFIHDDNKTRQLINDNFYR